MRGYDGHYLTKATWWQKQLTKDKHTGNKELSFKNVGPSLSDNELQTELNNARKQLQKLQETNTDHKWETVQSLRKKQ